jgi:hypothetical protein
MDQNPIFKMESNFRVCEFRGKLNSVTRTNISLEKMKEEKEEDSKTKYNQLSF